MPTSRKTTKAAMAAAAAMPSIPSIPKELIDQFVTRPMSSHAGQFRPFSQVRNSLLLAGLLTPRNHGDAVIINRSYVLNGGPLPNNFA